MSVAPEKVTVLSEPRSTSSLVNGEWKPGPPRHEKHELLMLELQRHTRASVSLVHATLAEAPSQGLVIWDPAQLIRPAIVACSPELRARIIVNLPRVSKNDATARELLEEHGVAGVVSGLDSYRMHTLDGLASVAKKIGARSANYVQPQFRDEFAGMSVGDRYESLGALLAAYVEEYAKERLC